jgi:alpha-ketoglutarate-dependent taurine dioxygenase
MKISKIPGLGRFGVFVDELDFNKITDEEWFKLGKLHLSSLVTIIRDVNLTPKEYYRRINQWGTPRSLMSYNYTKKYRELGYDPKTIDPELQKWSEAGSKIMATEVDPDTKMVRVSGKKDEQGNPLGMFAEGELLWHSNESGNLSFTPGVSLLGVDGVVGSATGFVTTSDWYEEQSNSFRSELDEIVIRHKFTPGRINPGLRKDQDFIMYKNMCPEDSEIPLVCLSPAGIKGLHYSINTIDSVVGMTEKESKKFFEQIDKTLFVEKYTYDHWYQQNNDLCLFDNSITLHRRLGGITDRLCYRIQYDYSKIIPSKLPRYIIEPFHTNYMTQLHDINHVLGIK